MGTLAVGLFGVVEDGNTTKGLFYGGGFRQLGIQALAVIVILAWTAVMMTIVFFVIKETVGLRVSERKKSKVLILQNMHWNLLILTSSLLTIINKLVLILFPLVE